MTQITASDFRKRCLDLLESLGPEGLVIMRHNRPIIMLVPIEAGKTLKIGCATGRLRIAATPLLALPHPRVKA